MINSKNDAHQLLNILGAPEHLKKHILLVGEATELLIKKLNELNIQLDFEFIRIGVVIHDIGKIKHPTEMINSGSKHETAGQELLLSLGVEPKIARCCVSHSQFSTMECSIEELIIALSDKLWKGKRVKRLEMRIIDELADLMGKDRWDIFSKLDSQFEFIANGGDERLRRSVITE